MRIDFQLSLDEWIEWKRANLSRNRVMVLRLAERSVIPLAILAALTTFFAWLRHVPGWLPIVIIALIGVGQIFLSTVPGFRKTALKKEWLHDFAQQRFTVETNEYGFNYFSARGSYKPTWDEVAAVYQTKHLLIFCNDDTYVLLIPKRAFASKKQLDEFIELAYQKTVTERHAGGGSF